MRESLNILQMVDQMSLDIYVFMDLLSYHWDVLILSIHV